MSCTHTPYPQGGEILTGEATDDVFQEMVVAFAELSVSVGLIASVIPRYPQVVQEAWDERIRDYVTWARHQTGEVQEFASAYDEE